MHKAPEIARFVKTHLRAVLPDFTGQYKRRDIYRMHGHVMQWIPTSLCAIGKMRYLPASTSSKPASTAPTALRCAARMPRNTPGC